MVCVPTVSVAVVKVACPVEFSIPVARVVVPSVKVTLPVGVPLEAATVAVNVTDCA